MPKHKILLLDDEQNIINSVTRIIRGDDREIVSANDADSAWDLLKKINGVDLIISDNKLPTISGVDFLTKVRQLYPDAIRILITGYPDLDSTIKAINAGQIYRFITKPWENEELKMIVKQALDYCDILKDNRVLIALARKQSEALNTMQKRYNISQSEFDKSGVYIIDEQKVSETLDEFMKKYYPQGIK